jgi:osmotically-inducible protein OsmY
MADSRSHTQVGGFGEIRHRYRSFDAYRGPYGGYAHSHARSSVPKPYRHEDVRMLDEVAERIGHHEWLDAGDVVIAVGEGTVYLSGTIKSRRQKLELERVARQVSGVRNVLNEVLVRGHSP